MLKCEGRKGYKSPMSSTETTELKLQSTPTGGVDASHSPYYRRLLSAGYKGYLQGTIGGASLYGALGLVIGGLIAAPLLIAGTFGAATSVAAIASAASLAAAFGAAGLVKGASTFGTIGSTAAINAESADLSEQRRYLLDRYYDLPEGPEGDREAEAIKQELMREREGRDKPPPFFHWQTALIGASLAAAVVLGFMYFAGPVISVGAIEAAAHSLLHITITHSTATALAGLAPPIITATATFGGALLGSTIGIDRYYIRKWFNHTEGVVHGSHHKETALIARSEQIARLRSAAKADEKTKQQIHSTHAARAPQLAASEIAPSMPEASAPIASLSKADETPKPSTKIMASEATLQRRLADIQQAMEVPAL